MNNMPVGMMPQSASIKAGRLRPVKSVESLVSSPLYQGSSMSPNPSVAISSKESKPIEQKGERREIVTEDVSPLSKSAPSAPVTSDVQVVFHPPPQPAQHHEVLSTEPRSLQNPKTHNRLVTCRIKCTCSAKFLYLIHVKFISLS